MQPEPLTVPAHALTTPFVTVVGALLHGFAASVRIKATDTGIREQAVSAINTIA